VKLLSRLVETDTIREIELTELGKKPLRKIDFVHGEKRVQILHNPARLLILQILRDGVDDTLTEESFDKNTQILHTKRQVVKRHALSVLEIIKISKNDSYDTLTKNQIYHHLPLLEEGGFVVKHGIVTKGKRKTDYYRRTAENFITYGLHFDPEKYSKAIKKDIASALPVFEFNLSKEETQELAELLVNAEVMRLKWAPMVENLVIDDIADDKLVEMFDRFLWIYSIGQNDFLQVISEIRSLVFKNDEF